MKKFLLATAALAVLAIAPTAHAENDYWPTRGFYVAGAGGAVLQRNADFDRLSGTPRGGEVEYDLGWGVSGAAGYGWSWLPGLRTELELSYRSSKSDKVNYSGSSRRGSADVTNVALLANAIYDIDTNSRWTPYVGFGLGGASVSNDFSDTGLNAKFDKNSYRFAYQGIAGVSYAICPQIALTADYRYYATEGDSSYRYAGNKINLQNASHNIFFGVRYAFNKPESKAEPVVAEAPAPAPAPVVAPVVEPVPQSYVVFFDFNKATLTPEAKRILVTAADEARKGQNVRLEVTGHTDTSGSAKYNQKLSVRRADAVKAELVRLGLSAQEITTRGAGQNELLVPTANGVREAQNRRAEIVVQ